MEIVAATDPPAASTAAHLLLFSTRAAASLGEGAAGELDAALDGALRALAEEGEIRGKSGAVAVLHPLGRAPMKRVLVAGLGDPEKVDPHKVRHATANAARRARALAGGDLAVAVAGAPLTGWSEAECAQAVTEGALLGLYRFDRHLHPAEPQHTIPRLTILGREQATLQRGIERGRILAEATNFARDLANEPSNLLTPSVLAERAATMAVESGLACQILEEAEAEALGMGAFLGVARGSHQPAKLIVLRHHGGGDEPGLGLVGKGITFDSGGISHQARRQYGGDEAGHERRRGGDRGGRRARPLGGASQPHRHCAGHGEHARRQRDQARRRAHGHERQDHRGDQYGRGGALGPGRRLGLRQPPGPPGRWSTWRR